MAAVTASDHAVEVKFHAGVEDEDERVKRSTGAHMVHFQEDVAPDGVQGSP